MSEVALIPEASVQAEPTLAEQRLVRFQLGDEHFAFSVDSVTGIIRWKEVTPLPSKEKHLLGLANLRGRTMPVSDLRLMMGLPTEVDQTDGFIIVTENEHGQVGFLVDDVAEVITITENDIQEQISDNGSAIAKLVRGIVNLGGSLISIVDMHALTGVKE